jgi:DNA-binding NtrC family response regulator
MLRLRQRRASYPCLVISAWLDLATRNRAVALGAADLLLKPIDGNRLRNSVSRALGDPRVTDPLFQELRGKLVGEAPVFLDAVLKLSQAIRGGDTGILLIGESGVGKEIFAQLVHQKSRPASTRIEAVNIAGFSESLIESELFGHEKGAFTGADRMRCGAFERAGAGTLFLDEIGDLNPALQPKLLRAIEQRQFYRVGGSQPMKFEARLVCATSRNLAAAVRSGVFRPDLYHRVSEFEIRIPPLRERKGDMRPLAEHFLRDTGAVLEREAMAVLESYSFPGNVRELQNLLKQAVAVHKGRSILPADLPGEIMQEREATGSEAAPGWDRRLLAMSRSEALVEIEKDFDRIYLQQRIAQAGGNRTKAAEAMGITPKTLRQKLRECGLGHLVGPEEEEKT